MNLKIVESKLLPWMRRIAGRVLEASCGPIEVMERMAWDVGIVRVTGSGGAMVAEVCFSCFQVCV